MAFHPQTKSTNIRPAAAGTYAVPTVESTTSNTEKRDDDFSEPYHPSGPSAFSPLSSRQPYAASKKASIPTRYELMLSGLQQAGFITLETQKHIQKRFTENPTETLNHIDQLKIDFDASLRDPLLDALEAYIQTHPDEYCVQHVLSDSEFQIFGYAKDLHPEYIHFHKLQFHLVPPDECPFELPYYKEGLRS